MPWTDVAGALVHIPLSGIDNSAERARLEAIPTGLSFPAADVAALVACGERLLRDNTTIRAIAAAAGPGRGEFQPASPAARGSRVAVRSAGTAITHTQATRR